MLHIYIYDISRLRVKSPNNTSKWQMGINSAFEGLMLYWTEIAVSPETYTGHINDLWRQNVGLLNVTPNGYVV